MPTEPSTNVVPISGAEERPSAWIVSLFSEFYQEHKTRQQRFLEFYSDFMRIPRLDDTQGTGIARTGSAYDVFIGQTRQKVRAAHARQMDALFAGNSIPVTVEASQGFHDLADLCRRILVRQFKDSDLRRTVSSAAWNMDIYGTGFVVGPFSRMKKVKKIRRGAMGQITREEVEEPCAYFDVARTVDVYPDPESKTSQDGRGMFWAEYITPEDAAVYGDDYYQAAKQAIGPQDTSSGTPMLDSVSSMLSSTRDGRAPMLHFWGRMPEGNDEVYAVMIGTTLLRLDPNPGQRPIMRAVYEESESEFWGVGPAENNEMNQRIINGGFRLFLEGKGFSLLGMFDIDRSKYAESEDFRMHPGKVFQRRAGVTQDEAKGAINQIKFEDVTEGWKDVIALAAQFSDDDTGVLRYDQGLPSNHFNQTATGINLLMGASALPMKDVMDNIDRDWIVPVAEAQMRWNLDHLTEETVAGWFGQEDGERWRAIREFGDTAFMTLRSSGSSGYVSREVRAQKLSIFAQIATSNTMFMAATDTRRLLELMWAASELGPDGPVYSEQAMMQREQAAASSEAIARENAIADSKAALNMARANKASADAKIKEMTSLSNIRNSAKDADTRELEAKVRMADTLAPADDERP